MLLLIGGNGFLGSHTASVAVARGHTVGVVGTRLEPSARVPQAAHYAQRDSDAYRDMLSEANTIVYLAHASRPSRHTDGLAYELETNIPAVNDFVRDLSVEGFTGQLFYTSSGGQVYGHRAPIPATETEPTRPTTAYGMGKLICEEIIRYAARVQGLNAAILRVANPVGSGQIGTGHGLVGAIFRALRDDVPLQLYGAGDNQRDYFSADDFGHFISDLHDKSWRGDGTYNIGNGVGHTELDVFNAVRDVVGHVPEIIFKDARPFDLPYAVVDCGKARGHLGWNPKHSLEDIIADLAQEHLETLIRPVEGVTA